MEEETMEVTAVAVSAVVVAVVAAAAAAAAAVVAEDVATVVAGTVATEIQRRHRPAVVVAPSWRASTIKNGYTTASNFDS